MKYLVTGGAGYLGRHLVDSLVSSGHECVIFDDFSGNLNQPIESNEIFVYRSSIIDKEEIAKVFIEHQIDGVFHLAAKKSVRESELNPKLYWDVNVLGTVNLVELCSQYGVSKLIFTSSAAVYGSSVSGLPILETDSPQPLSIYGKTKLEAERLLSDLADEGTISLISLRLFNLVGASSLDRIDKNAENLLSVLLRSYESKTEFKIFGRDFLTPDGTCVRDYVNVRDVVSAYMKAMQYLELTGEKVNLVFNISSGLGTSVLEIVDMFKENHAEHLQWKYEDRRPGDAAWSIGNNQKSLQLLGWKPVISIEESVIETMPTFKS